MPETGGKRQTRAERIQQFWSLVAKTDSCWHWLGAYAVVAERQQRLEDDERNMRAARRQLELFLDDDVRERVTVALALLDESVESRNGAWALTQNIYA